MKSIAKAAVSRFTQVLIGISMLNRLVDEIIKAKLSYLLRVKHKEYSFNLHAPNEISLRRAKTYSQKEPETLAWIDSFSKDSVLWDIGANMGHYSIYAAKTKNCQVVSFEPLSSNVDILIRNINSNLLNNHITVLPLPLAKKTGLSEMFDSMGIWGGAQASFSQNIGWDGKPLQHLLRYKTLGIAMDDLIDILGFSYPNYIKIDVDGTEHLLLQGGKKVLARANEILIEINDSFLEQSEVCEMILNNAGFHRTQKTHSEIFEGASTFNQIWKK